MATYASVINILNGRKAEYEARYGNSKRAKFEAAILGVEVNAPRKPMTKAEEKAHLAECRFQNLIPNCTKPDLDQPILMDAEKLASIVQSVMASVSLIS